MTEHLNNDLVSFESLLDAIKHQGLDYLTNLNNRPTSTKQKPILSEALSEWGVGGINTLKLFNEKFEKLIVGSSGPRYWGFVTGGTTPASIMGDWLTSIYDQNTQSTKGQGDSSANIEIETIKLLLDLFNLPNDYLGGFVSGATMSNFTCLATARQWIGNQLGKDYAKEGITKKVNVLSALPHSSVVKSLAMIGIGSSNILKINVEQGNRESIDINDLQVKIKELKGQPFILISSAGTVNTVDFDDFKALAKLKKEHNFWWHIDGAFGAFVACSPKYKYLIEGWELADSITIDSHKWLNVPYESAFFLIKAQHRMLQIDTFQNSNAPYLGDPLDNFSYLNFLPENSRRLKALPTWFSLNAYGKKGYQYIVENSVEMAKHFGSFIIDHHSLELLAPVRLNNVCFTLRNIENQDKVNIFLTKLNDTGKVFMTLTIYGDKKGIRASFVNWRTSKSDVEIVINEIKKIMTE